MESFRNGSRSRRHSHTDGDDLRPDYSLISACEQAKLYRIVHEMLLAYCGSRGKVVVLPLLSIYERLLSWRKDLPISIRDVRAEDEAPPHQLFLQ